jgi:hypothetical protein
MTSEEPTALEEEMREAARRRAARALMFLPLVAGVAMVAILALTIGLILAALGRGE